MSNSGPPFSGKLYIDYKDGNGPQYIGDAGPLRIAILSDPLDTDTVIEDILDADEIGDTGEVVVIE